MHMNIYITGQTEPRFIIKDPPAIPRVGDDMIYDDVDGDPSKSTALRVSAVLWRIESPTGLKHVSVFLTP